jgi:hypothetical protein
MGTFDLSASEFRALFERVKRMSMWGRTTGGER